MRSVWLVLRNLELSGKTSEIETRLLPANTCPPTPIRNAGLRAQANAKRRSLIAPRTLFCSVTSVVSPGAPTASRLNTLVSYERSRKVEELRPSVHRCPTGSTPDTRGKRAVVVLAVFDPTVTRRNS